MAEISDETLPLPCSTTFDFPGKKVERHIGLAWGLVVRSIGFAKGFTGSIRALRSGEVDEYTEVLEQARATRSTASSSTRKRWARTPSPACGSTPRRSATTCPRSSPTERP